jgi:hypothetical protein
MQQRFTVSPSRHRGFQFLFSRTLGDASHPWQRRLLDADHQCRRPIGVDPGCRVSIDPGCSSVGSRKAVSTIAIAILVCDGAGIIVAMRCDG